MLLVLVCVLDADANDAFDAGDLQATYAADFYA